MCDGYLVVPLYNSNHDVPSHVHAEVCSADVIRFNPSPDPDRRPYSFHSHTTPWSCLVRSRSLPELHSGKNPTGRTHHSP